MRAAIRRALSRSDRGSTITETVVVMMILGIVVAATAALTIGVSRTTGQTMARQDQVDAARVSVERLAKTTRTAVKPSQLSSDCRDSCANLNAFMQGTALSMQFYGNLDNVDGDLGASRISYAVATSGPDAGVLVEKVQRPDVARPADGVFTYCPAESAGASAQCRSRLTVRRVATGVQTTRALFRYYAEDGTRLTPSAAGLSTADLARLMAVEVVLTVQSDSSTDPQPTTYIQRITLPNAQAVLQQQNQENTP